MNRFRHWLAEKLRALADRIDVIFLAGYTWTKVGFRMNPKTGKMEYYERAIPAEEIYKDTW